MIKQFFKKNIIFISYLFAFIVVTIILVNTFLYVTASMRTIVHNIRYRLIAASKLAAQLVTPEELDEFQTAEDMNKPSYQALRRKLYDLAHELDVLYIYYERPVGNKMQYIVDNDYDEETRVGLDSPPYEYTDNVDWMLQVLEEGLTTCSEFRQYIGDWEGIMFANSPIFDKDGKVVAVAGADIDDMPIVRAWRFIYILIVAQIVVIVIITTFSVIGHINSRKEAEKAWIT